MYRTYKKETYTIVLLNYELLALLEFKWQTWYGWSFMFINEKIWDKTQIYLTLNEPDFDW